VNLFRNRIQRRERNSFVGESAQVNNLRYMMTQKYDVIVIGGGHNGLVNAAYLARAGKRVLVLERRHVLGGAAVNRGSLSRFQIFGLLICRLALTSGDHS